MEEGIRPGLRRRIESADARLRVFGLGLGAILLFAAWRWGRKDSAAAPAALVLGLAAAALGLACPARLAGLERVWMAVMRRVAAVNTHVILAAIYYLVVTPFALLGRLIQGAPLPLSPDGSKTYWEPHASPTDPGSYRRPF